MAYVTLWEGNGTAAGPAAGKFYVHRRVYYDPSECTATQIKVYRVNAIYGPSASLTAGSGKASWSSGTFKIGATGTTVTYNGKTYYISAKATVSAYYDGGSIYSMPKIYAYYSGNSGTKYQSDLEAGNITLPSLIPTYAVTYNANGGTGAPDTQYKQEGTTLTLSTEQPTLTDKIFKRWNGSDGNTYKPGDSYTTDAELTLTAVWGGKNDSWIKPDGTYHEAKGYPKVNKAYKDATAYVKINGHYKEAST